jgi:short-subunit dehydrogenase
VEIEQIDQAPVSITLIQPTAVDTPFPEHARNFMDREPMLPKPVIEPQQVADAILHAAQHPTRDKTVGAMSLMNTALSKFAPGLADKMAAKQVNRMQYDELPRNPDGALYRPSQQTEVAAQTHGTGGREPR